MQTNGNLVLYDNAYSAKWDSGTASNSGAFLALTDDGLMSIRKANWTTLKWVTSNHLTWFNSSMQWPPKVLNNSGSNGFQVRFWGHCMDGTNFSQNPAMNFVATPSYDGTYSGANPANGAWEVSCPGSANNITPNSHIAIDTGSKTFGSWLGSKPFRINDVGRTWVLWEPLYRFPDNSSRPFQGYDYLETSWHIRTQPSTSVSCSNIPAYDVANVLLRDPAGNRIDVNIPLWDTRGKTSSSCSLYFFGDITGVPIAHTCFSNTVFDKRPGKATYWSWISNPWIEIVSGDMNNGNMWDATYTYRLRPRHVRKILTEYNAWRNQQSQEYQSSHPTFDTSDAAIAQLSVVEVSFNTELDYSYPACTSTLGIAKWNWTVKKFYQ
jgi:hypothetical protein